MKYPAMLLAVSVLSGWGCSSSWLFSNRSYWKHIVAEAYLLNKEQVADLFSGQKVTQLPYDRLSDPVYFVVRLQNTDSLAAWGTLKCKSDNGYWKRVDFSLTHQPDFVNYVSPICGMPIDKYGKFRNTKIPTFTFEQAELYTK